MNQNVTLIAEDLQKEAHAIIDKIKSVSPESEYQDIMNSYFYLKLAELYDKTGFVHPKNTTP
jgi:hypothetical protein